MVGVKHGTLDGCVGEYHGDVDIGGGQLAEFFSRDGYGRSLVTFLLEYDDARSHRHVGQGVLALCVGGRRVFGFVKRDLDALQRGLLFVSDEAGDCAHAYQVISVGVRTCR